MQIKKIILINLVVLFILIFIIELTLRVIFSYNVQGLSENLINKSLNFNFHNSNLQNGKAFGVRIYTDKNGFRITKNHQGFKKKKNILFVGGSVTFGAGVKAQNTYVEKLNKFSKFNVMNASVFGSNLENNLIILKSFKEANEFEKVFINFPLDDILTSKVLIDDKEQNVNFTNKIKSNNIINYINRFLRSKSATYVFIKSLAVNPKINNYLYDVKLYKNEELIKQLDINLSEVSKIYNPKKIFFYAIPYAAQVMKTNCMKKDDPEIIIKKIFNKNNFEILNLKEKMCADNNAQKFFLKNDPVHLSKSGHEFVFENLKNYIN